MRKGTIDGALFGLLFAFGLSSWGTVNFLFSEVPILAERYPTIGWSVGTYITAAVAATNIFAVICVVVSHFLSAQSMRKLTTGLVILILVADLTAGIFFTWDPAPNNEILFIVFTGVAGLGATLSAVAFIPFTSRFPPVYTPGLTSGTAASAMLAGALSLVQNPGSKNLFSFNIFISIALVVTCGSVISFILIMTLPRFKRIKTNIQNQNDINEKNDNDSIELNNDKNEINEENNKNSIKTNENNNENEITLTSSTSLSQNQNNNDESEKILTESDSLIQNNNKRKFSSWGDIIKLFYLSFLENGITMSLSSYALMQYSSTSFVIANSISAFSDPLVNLLPAMLSVSAVRVLDKPIVQVPTITVFTVASLYVVILSMTSNSKTPLLADKSVVLGAVIACTARVLVRIGTALIKVRAFMVLHGAKKDTSDDKKRMGLSQMGGLAMQIGTTLGAGFAFLLTKLYIEKV